MNYQLPTTTPSTEFVAVETNKNSSNNQNNNLTMNQNTTTTTQATINKITVETMTIQQLERYHYLSMHYGVETTIEIIGNLTSHGINSWGTLCKKISNNSTLKDDSESKYFEQINSEIKLGQTYSLSMIIQLISKIRKDLKLQPYQKNIFKSCLKDFLQQHMAIPILSEDIDLKTQKKTVLAYKPIIEIKY